MLVVVVLILLVLGGSRAAPITTDASHLHPPRSSRSNPTHDLNSLRLPDNFNITGTCLKIILKYLCKGFYYNAPSSTYDHGSDRLFCKGMECRLESLTDYCNKSAAAIHAQTTDWNGRSQPQRPLGHLPSTNNLNPTCQRYKKDIDVEEINREGGRSCSKKLDCLCGDCCSSQSREEVLKTMLEQKYTNLVRRLPNMAQHGKMFRDKQAIHPRYSPKNFPLTTTTNTPCLHQPC